MRRIPLALALVGAVAVTGCMGGGKSSGTTDSDAQQGVVGVNYYIKVSSPAGGYISSDVGNIICGQGIDVVCNVSFAWDQTVVLTAHPSGTNALIAWAGDCAGAGLECTINAADPVTGLKNPGADKTVAAVFGAPGSGHGNYLDPAVHGPAYWAWYADPVNAALKCSACHGPNLAGMSIAPSCSACHSAPPLPGVVMTSGHFDPTAAPWGDHTTGWTAACLRCHTQGGFKDWLNVPGGAYGAGLVGYLDNPFTGLVDSNLVSNPPGPGYASGPMTCDTCHNSVSKPAGTGITTVVFPSNLRVTTDKATALCSQCHGARESSSTIETKLAAALPLPHTDDTVLVGSGTGTSFMNPHYLGAAATMFGSEAAGWVQYPGKAYTARNQHGVIAGSCVSCHDPHTLTVTATTSTCGRCHFNEVTGLPVANMTELEESRQFGYDAVDVDADGTVEPLKAEIEGLAAVVLERMQAYERLAVKSATITYGICYTEAYPYFNQDTNDNGVCDIIPGTPATGEVTAFKMFTPRLMRAAVNLKWSHTESNAWAHGPRYAIEILYDTIMDLDAAVVALGGTSLNFQGYRSFEGHFGGVHTATHNNPVDHSGSEAFHDWDPGPVGTACAQCHGGQKGIEKYLGLNLPAAMPADPPIAPVTGFECTTCHAPVAGDTGFWRMRSIAAVYFPPQKTAAKSVAKVAADFEKASDMVCSTCHSGRENGTSVQDKTCLPAGSPTCVDVATWTVGFTNPHYLGAAGILFGTDAKVMYQYAGKTYSGKSIFWGSPHGSPHGASCTGCHKPQASKHSFEVDLAYCATCHTGGYALEPKKTDITTLATATYTAIQAYATGAGNPVCYNGAAYPYWFKDNGFDGTAVPVPPVSDGICDAAESVSANGAKFDAKGARAAFNYKWSQAEPGAYAHNFEYMSEVLYDTILDLGGTPPPVIVR